MGKRAPIRPFYTRDLDALIAAETEVRAMCDGCGEWKRVDLARLAAARGGTLDLWNRTTPCRLTEGCGGRNRFYFNGRGRMEPMRD